MNDRGKVMALKGENKMWCGFDDKPCCICGNADGNCLAAIRDDFFFPATKEQVEKRLAEGRYACDREIMENYAKSARGQANIKTSVCCESKIGKVVSQFPEQPKEEI